ncbi:MAG: formylglycine-generating enzyme family protein [Magnetococcales bacterium]|nr:formylglycine-generating enzyme family protein [Magnetococcales bacterium]
MLEFRDDITGMKFVWIPPGTFRMGSVESEDGHKPSEAPLHDVSLDGFWMGMFAVTQGEWCKLIHENPAHFRRGANYPVERVSWYDAMAFIELLNLRSGGGFRLPTEAEWEYACRAGSVTPFSFGETIRSNNQVNFNGSCPCRGFSKGLYRQSTMPVGSFPANGFGLYDMHGNVWEWCMDGYDPDYYATPQASMKNPFRNEVNVRDRVLRGGSYDNGAKRARSAERYWHAPTSRYDYIGFRLVRTP